MPVKYLDATEAANRWEDTLESYFNKAHRGEKCVDKTDYGTI